MTIFCLDHTLRPLERLWCLYEVWMTLTLNPRGEHGLQVVTGDLYAPRVHNPRQKEIFGKVDVLDVSAAQTSKEPDRQFILGKIDASHNTREVMNSRIRVAINRGVVRADMRFRVALEGEGQFEQSQLATISLHIPENIEQNRNAAYKSVPDGMLTAAVEALRNAPVVPHGRDRAATTKEENEAYADTLSAMMEGRNADPRQVALLVARFRRLGWHEYADMLLTAF
ncbi:hypothetical protein WJX72_011196 [[Myrmecia] bisecta]|uniref:Uncharacterized protein n=1 Tax=[Myrmecia] bisecta TaxID=41462 RepID=A0AAW1R9U5_9CHLO